MDGPPTAYFAGETAAGRRIAGAGRLRARLVAPCCDLLRLVATCCAVLRLVAACCALLRRFRVARERGLNSSPSIEHARPHYYIIILLLYYYTCYYTRLYNIVRAYCAPRRRAMRARCGCAFPRAAVAARTSHADAHARAPVFSCAPVNIIARRVA